MHLIAHMAYKESVDFLGGMANVSMNILTDAIIDVIENLMVCINSFEAFPQKTGRNIRYLTSWHMRKSYSSLPDDNRMESWKMTHENHPAFARQMYSEVVF